MNGNDILKLGIPTGPAVGHALNLAKTQAASGISASDLASDLAAVVASPESFRTHALYSQLAEMLTPIEPAWVERSELAPWKQWGADLDPAAIAQLESCARLPVAVAGALMPDAHRGYGLPIGGVLATENAVIPYAVGVDIACRMRLSVVDLPVEALTLDFDRLVKAIEEETSFGIGAEFRKGHRRGHEVLDQDWSVSPITKRLADKGYRQLGSSGSGNHFVEFGVLTLDKPDLGLPAGQYLALLSHSGSRGVGANVAGHYSKLAMSQHPELPHELRHLAWLEMDSAEGQEYWAAMSLMGDYAAANHECIHREVLRNLGATSLADVENHHNFAWKEFHHGKEVIVHRKGATPAGEGVMGIIPGSMSDPGFVVRGKGNADSLASASHGAGRVMSRTAAKKSLNWSDLKTRLAADGVTLLSAGIDEAPAVYKDIHEVMGHQEDLVETVARFDPKIVKMAPSGEPPED